MTTTPERVAAIAELSSHTTLAVVAVAALRDSGHLYNAAQKQRLVDTISTHWNWRLKKNALETIPQLTEDQKGQLTRAYLRL